MRYHSLDAVIEWWERERLIRRVLAVDSDQCLLERQPSLYLSKWLSRIQQPVNSHEEWLDDGHVLEGYIPIRKQISQWFDH